MYAHHPIRSQYYGFSPKPRNIEPFDPTCKCSECTGDWGELPVSPSPPREDADEDRSDPGGESRSGDRQSDHSMSTDSAEHQAKRPHVRTTYRDKARAALAAAAGSSAEVLPPAPLLQFRADSGRSADGCAVPPARLGPIAADRTLTERLRVTALGHLRRPEQVAECPLWSAALQSAVADGPMARAAANEIASAAGAMLDWVANLRCELAYRLELRRSRDDFWKLTLKLDAGAWADAALVARTDETFRQDLHEVEVALRAQEAHERAFSSAAVEIPQQVPWYCDRQLMCKGCSRPHATVVCRHNLGGTDGWGNKLLCNTWLVNEMEVPLLGRAEYKRTPVFATARSECTRELLVQPNPVCEGHDYQHATNAQWARDPLCWLWVLDIIVAASVALGRSFDATILEAVALNYGEWETRASKMADSRECHAHVHLQLSESAAAGLGATEPYKALAGRTRPMKSYAKEDLSALREHLPLAEVRDLVRTVDKLSADVRAFIARFPAS